MTTTATLFERCLSAYIETALWSSMDESDDRGGSPMDANYGRADIHPDSIDQMRRDVSVFLMQNMNDIDSANVATAEYDRYERAAHDFWLTRNGHGVGFWDGNWSEPEASRLTEAAKRFGTCDLCIGDDGLVYAS